MNDEEDDYDPGSASLNIGCLLAFSAVLLIVVFFGLVWRSAGGYIPAQHWQ